MVVIFCENYIAVSSTNFSNHYNSVSTYWTTRSEACYKNEHTNATIQFSLKS